MEEKTDFEKLEEAKKELEDKYSLKIAAFEKDLSATLPLEKERFLVSFIQSSIEKAINAYLAKLSDEEKIDLYTKEISEIPKVSAVKFIRGRTYGSNIFLDVVVEMSPDLSVFESHAATEDIEETLKEKYDVFFTQVKERLVPLIQKVVHAEPIRDDFLYQSYPVEGQKKFMDDVLKYLLFDPSWGYQNETEHPFTSGTCQNDMRTTTKYLENSLASAILSTVHEVGHATYGHDVDPAYDGTILTEGISSGMHESQSRLFENYLGRTEAFWSVLYPKLQAIFPEQLQGITAKEFTDAVNASSPSLIRTAADELTYPIHILIRYELEKGLFDGSISTEGLDQTWDHLYQKYLLYW